MKLTTAILVLLLATGADAQWFAYQPPGSVDGKGILQDVLSRCDEQGRQAAYESDRVTYCHEATHQVNARIRNSIRGGRVNAFYVGSGRAMVLAEPNIQLQTVAKYISPQMRNSTFPTAAQFEHWNNQPLYVLDELAAYSNGSQAARELGCEPFGTHERAEWFCHYSDALVAAVKQHDPQYRQLDDLTYFVEWQKQRVQGAK